MTLIKGTRSAKVLLFFSLSIWLGCDSNLAEPSQLALEPGICQTKVLAQEWLVTPDPSPVIDSRGYIYYREQTTEPERHGISRLSPEGDVEKFWLELDSVPHGLAINDTDELYFHYSGRRPLEVYKGLSGKSILKIYENPGLFTHHLHVTPEGDILLSDNPFANETPCGADKNNLYRLSSEGHLLEVHRCVGSLVKDIVFDRHGNIYTLNSNSTDGGRPSISKIYADGTVINDWVKLDIQGLNLAIDSEGSLFTSVGHHRHTDYADKVVKIDKNGSLTTSSVRVGDSGLQYVYVDHQDRLYVSNYFYTPAQSSLWILDENATKDKVVWQDEDGRFSNVFPPFFTINEVKFLAHERTTVGPKQQRTLLISCGL